MCMKKIECVKKRFPMFVVKSSSSGIFEKGETRVSAASIRYGLWDKSLDSPMAKWFISMEPPGVIRRAFMIVGVKGYQFLTKKRFPVGGVTIFMTDCIIQNGLPLEKGLQIQNFSLKTSDPTHVCKKMSKLPAAYIVDLSISGKVFRLSNLYTMAQVLSNYETAQLKNKLGGNIVVPVLESLVSEGVLSIPLLEIDD